MNLAVVITASHYNPPQTPLPACDCDADLIEALVGSSADFDDKLILRNLPDSAVIKKRLTEFIAKHKGSDIDQVFFYFSGHGDFSGNELFYLLPDYDEKQKRQTSLENSELDSLLRGLQPNTAVKVIDACHSGVPYIKDTDAFQNYIKGTKDEFKKCYFMFSSHMEQASYQNAEFSFFTKSFVQAIAQHSADPVRLKDIIDYVADAFSGNPQQTPFFVVQADFTEPFCRVTEPLKKRLLGLLAGTGSGPHPAKAEPQKSMVDLVTQEAQAYCSQEEATAILNRLADFASQGPGKEEVEQLYDVVSSRLDDFSEVPQIKSVASWLHGNKHGLFTEVITGLRSEQYEDVWSQIQYQFGPEDKRRYKTRKVAYPKGLRHTTTMPYCCIRVCANPKYPNIDATVSYIVPLVSETELRIFSGFGCYKKAGWTEQALRGDIDWKTSAIPLKDESGNQDKIRSIFLDFWEYTLEPLKERLGLLKESAEDAESQNGKPKNSDREEPEPDQPLQGSPDQPEQTPECD